MSRANPRRVSSGHSELCYPLMTGNHGGKFVAAKTPVYLQYPSTIITAAIGCCDFNSIRVCTWMLIVWLYLSSLGAQSLHAQSGSNGVHGFGSTRSAAYQCVNTATGRIIPYCYMRFSAPVGIRTTGGHFHEVNRPSGKVATSRNGSFRDTVTIQANALGIATVWYKTNSRTIGQTEKLKDLRHCMQLPCIPCWLVESPSRLSEFKVDSCWWIYDGSWQYRVQSLYDFSSASQVTDGCLEFPDETSSARKGRFE